MWLMWRSSHRPAHWRQPRALPEAWAVPAPYVAAEVAGGHGRAGARGEGEFPAPPGQAGVGVLPPPHRGELRDLRPRCPGPSEPLVGAVPTHLLGCLDAREGHRDSPR